MFFVGATGQLLTLLLTVCLPFIFIISGHHKIEVQQALSINGQHEQHQIIDSNSHVSFSADYEVIAIVNTNQLKNLDPGYLVQRIHCRNFKGKWDSFYLNDSGNKAPPSTFFC